jgi:hypothetical protein
MYQRQDFKMMRRLSCAAAFSTLLLGAPAFAHHSFAMYDHTRTVTLEGTVKTYQWTNPHGYVELSVSDAKGAPHSYSLECTSINMMTRLGWTRNTIKPGDKIKAEFAPNRSDESSGLLMYVTLPDGKVVPTGVPNPTSFVRAK